MVPLALLRDPEIHSEQASRCVCHGWVDSGSARGAMARYQPGPFGPLQARVSNVFLDPGRRLRATHLCWRTTASGDLAVPEPNRRRLLFPAFPGRAATRRPV